ncbi:MAG: DUF998 domain-containing protein [Allosphingosinicella sp.]|uniref:DUF998 domain-containing protein n=1 Tax=Allosphingosinicella sp. TaxID=2823234 RepID=UPI00392C50C2
MTRSPPPAQDRLSRTAWLAGPAAALLFFASLILFAALREDGYTHGTKAVSELGAVGAPMAGAFNLAGLILPGAAIMLFGYGLLALSRRRAGAVLMIGSGAMLALSGLFAVDMEDLGAATSALHALGAMGAGLLWAAGLFAIRPVLAERPGLESWARATPWFLLFMIVHLGWQVAFQATGALLPGWGQRIGFFGYFLWFAATGLLLLREEGRGAGRA